MYVYNRSLDFFSLCVEVLSVDCGVVARVEEECGEKHDMSPLETNSALVVVVFIQLGHRRLLSRETVSDSLITRGKES